MTPVACCLTVAAFHVALQTWPRLLNHYFGVDCWRHMLAADFIRRHRRLPVESLDNYLFRGPFDYPPFVPILLACLPSGIRLAAQAVVAPLFESLHGILVFAIVQDATGDVLAAVLSQAVFSLVPITTLENSQLNARSPGSLFLSLCVLGATAFASGGQLVWLALSLTCGVLVHLTHKMASQTLILLSILGLPLAGWMQGVPVVGIASLGLAMLAFPKLVLRILTGHVAVLRFHRAQFSAGTDRSNTGVESRGFVGRAVAIAKTNPAITIAGAVPWVVLLPFLGSARPAAGLPPLLERVSAFWLVACLVLIVATSVVRPLRFLGDGPRYSFYLALPVALFSGPLLAAHAREHNALSRTCVIAGCVVATAVLAEICFLQWKGVVSDTERSYRGDIAAICDRLRAAPGARVAVFPLCTAEVIAFFGACRVLSTDSALAHAENVDFLAFNPHLLRPLSYFLERYSITHAVLEHRRRKSPEFTLPPEFTEVHSGRSFGIWERNAPCFSALAASGRLPSPRPS